MLWVVGAVAAAVLGEWLPLAWVAASVALVAFWELAKRSFGGHARPR